MQTVIRRAEPADDFRTLAVQVRAAGLLDRRLGYYWVKIVLTVGAFALGWAAFFASDASWAVLAVAVFLGLVQTQLGFLGHDAGHGQVFASRRANRLLGLAVGNGLIGLSFGWWVPKHSAHHAHPNELDRDPDVGVGLIGAGSADGTDSGGRGLAGWLDRWHAELFFPLMLLRSTGLYVSGVHRPVPPPGSRRAGRGARDHRLRRVLPDGGVLGAPPLEGDHLHRGAPGRLLALPRVQLRPQPQGHAASSRRAPG